MKTTVTERALIARIKRKLAKDGETLCKTRPRDMTNLGEYHIVDINLNTITAYHINDLEKLANELGVLAPYEVLVD